MQKRNWVSILFVVLFLGSCKNTGNAPSMLSIEGDYQLAYGSSSSDRQLLATRISGNVPPKFAEVVSRWKRFSGSTYFADSTAIVANPSYCDDNGMDGNGNWLDVINPGNGSTVNPNTASACNTETMNSLSWVYLTNPDRLFNIQNTNFFVGFFSTLKFENYTATATLSSTSTDDDAIGFSIAVYFDSVTNKVHTLSAYRTQGGLSPTLGWALVHKENETIVRVIGEKSVGGVNRNGVSGDQLGWNSRMSKVRIERTGNIVKAYASPWGTDSSTLVVDDASLIQVDLSDPAENLSVFVGAQPYGYESKSQSAASFRDLTFVTPQSNDDPDYLFDLRDNLVYGKKSDGMGYELLSGLKALEVLGFPKTITNLETQREFRIDSATSFTEL